MTKEEEYNMLRDKIIEVFQYYIKTLDTSTYQNLKQIGGTIPLLDAYIKAIKVNSEFMDFIIKNIRNR